MSLKNFNNSEIFDFINEYDFVNVLFISLVGRKPIEKEINVFNAILVFLFLFIENDSREVSESMEILEEINECGDDIEKYCENLLDSKFNDHKTIFGFSNNDLKVADNRVKTLFSLARKNNINTCFMDITKQIEHSSEYKLDKKLVLKLDGAIAAILMTLGVSPTDGNKIFSLNKIINEYKFIDKE